MFAVWTLSQLGTTWCIFGDQLMRPATKRFQCEHSTHMTSCTVHTHSLTIYTKWPHNSLLRIIRVDKEFTLFFNTRKFCEWYVSCVCYKCLPSWVNYRLLEDKHAASTSNHLHKTRKTNQSWHCQSSTQQPSPSAPTRSAHRGILNVFLLVNRRLLHSTPSFTVLGAQLSFSQPTWSAHSNTWLRAQQIWMLISQFKASVSSYNCLSPCHPCTNKPCIYTLLVLFRDHFQPPFDTGTKDGLAT